MRLDEKRGDPFSSGRGRGPLCRQRSVPADGARRSGGPPAFLAGAMPVLLIVLYFKLRLAPANDLVAGFSLAALADKLFDWDRYAR